MPSRRELIKMSPEEVEEFLQGRHTLNVATIGRDGWPHLVALWYGFFDSKIAFWTFGKSQKVANLRRIPKVSALVEAGENYEELRGVEIVGNARIVEDQEVVRAVGLSVFDRYSADSGTGFLDVFMATAPKRVAIVIDPVKIVSWDHSKLDGTY